MEKKISNLKKQYQLAENEWINKAELAENKYHKLHQKLLSQYQDFKIASSHKAEEQEKAILKTEYETRQY